MNGEKGLMVAGGVVAVAKRRSSFVEGALILGVSGVVTRLIGAFFKIPLGNLLGGSGMGAFTVAYQIYSALFLLSTAGLPVAISKMVAEARGRGCPGEGKRIFRVALGTFSLVGLLLSAGLWVASPQVAALVGSPQAAPAVRAVAPSLFLVSIAAVIRGYHQGLGDMVPTAVSQVLEAVGKLVVGYGAAVILLNRGCSPAQASAGAIGGVMVGSLLGCLYLLLHPREEEEGIGGRGLSAGRCLVRLLAISLPVMAGSLVLSLSNLMDMAIVMNRLQDIGFSQQASGGLYGTYNMVTTLFHLPQTLITALGVSLIPPLSGALSRKNRMLARRLSDSALEFAALLSLPAGVGFCLLGRPLLELIYFARPQDCALGAPLLVILGPGVFFVAMTTMTNAILQAMGRVRTPVYTLAAGALCKLGVTYVLTGKPTVHIGGAPWGTVCCYGLITLLNLRALYRAGMGVSWDKVFFRPALAAGLMGAFLVFLRLPVEGALGPRWGFAALTLSGAAFYGLMLLAVGALPREDILLLPGGKNLAKVLRLK